MTANIDWIICEIYLTFLSSAAEDIFVWTKMLWEANFSKVVSTRWMNDECKWNNIAIVPVDATNCSAHLFVKQCPHFLLQWLCIDVRCPYEILLICGAGIHRLQNMCHKNAEYSYDNDEKSIKVHLYFAILSVCFRTVK